MAIPGCAAGTHTTEKVEAPAPVLRTPPPTTMTKTADGKEVYSTGSAGLLNSSAQKPQPSPQPKSVLPPPAPAEDEDDISVAVAPGTSCKRLGCGKQYISDEESRNGDGDAAICVYHSLSPIFHEGSKGYMCCKRRVLDFDEFLQIAGCKTGKHVFVKKTSATIGEADELVKCRIDHYQTPSQVHVSIFAKKSDVSRSSIRFETRKLHVDLQLPDSKRFLKTLELFGDIDPAASTYKFYGTKVEVVLQKADNRSWNFLEQQLSEVPGYSITFGVGGRTGSVGAKNLVLDERNQSTV